MWNEKNSLALSKLLVGFFFITTMGCDAAGFWLVKWFLSWTRYRLVMELPYQALFMASLYALSIPAYWVLYQLYHLLVNIEKEKVFVQQNVHCLRAISWSCAAAALVCLVSAAYYLPYLLVMMAAAFMALILRIVKNVFERACLMQNELDLTV